MRGHCDRHVKKALFGTEIEIAERLINEYDKWNGSATKRFGSIFAPGHDHILEYVDKLTKKL